PYHTNQCHSRFIMSLHTYHEHTDLHSFPTRRSSDLKVKIKNYKRFKDLSIEFNNDFCVMVGNNGTGKSTIIEAIHLALTGKINGRLIYYEVSPYLFNRVIVQQFI